MGSLEIGKVGEQTPKRGDHICCIYSDENQHKVAMSELLKSQILKGYKVLYILDNHLQRTIERYLRALGLDPHPIIDRGQLGFVSADQSYLNHGTFNPDEMISLLDRETKHALSQGYPGLFVTGEMTWAQRGFSRYDKLIEYEAMCADFFAANNCLAACQYSRWHFPSEILDYILRTHNMIWEKTGTNYNGRGFPGRLNVTAGSLYGESGRN